MHPANQPAVPMILLAPWRWFLSAPDPQVVALSDVEGGGQDMRAGSRMAIRRTDFLAPPDSYVISSVLTQALFRLQRISRLWSWWRTDTWRY